MKIPSDFQQPSPFSPMNLCHMMASIMLKNISISHAPFISGTKQKFGKHLSLFTCQFFEKCRISSLFLIRDKKTTTHSAKGPWNKSLNLIFSTKYVIPKSLSRFALGWVDDNPKNPGFAPIRCLCCSHLWSLSLVPWNHPFPWQVSLHLR